MRFAQSSRVGRRAAAVILAAGMVIGVVPGTVVGAGRGATVVGGIQHEFGSCGAADAYLMDGSLVGCWWVDTFDLKPMPVQGTMLATGKEHFVGCLNGSVCGTFYTTYRYTARFDGATELHGRCHHPITGGTEGFAGARGELSFTDVVDSEPFFFPYWGNIQLGRGTQAVTTLTAVRASTSSAATAQGGVTAPC